MSEVIDRESARNALNVPMADEDSGATTVRGYLVALLRALWRDGEGFSGKRPFGNSGWEWDVYAALVKAGLVAGRFEDGYLDELTDDDRRFADRLILAAIDELGQSLTADPDVILDGPTSRRYIRDSNAESFARSAVGWAVQRRLDEMRAAVASLKAEQVLPILRACREVETELLARHRYELEQMRLATLAMAVLDPDGLPDGVEGRHLGIREAKPCRWCGRLYCDQHWARGGLT